MSSSLIRSTGISVLLGIGILVLQPHSQIQHHVRFPTFDNATEPRRLGDASPDFCGDCIWLDGHSCDHRKQQLMDRLKLSEDEAKTSLLENIEGGAPSPCIPIDPAILKQREEEEAQRKKVEEELAAKQAQEAHEAVEKERAALYKQYPEFCPTCYWHGRTSCEARLHWLMDHYKTSMEDAIKGTLGTPTCRNVPQNVVFCETCTWEGGINCLHRVQWMMSKHRITEDEAKEHVMQDGKCGATENT